MVGGEVDAVPQNINNLCSRQGFKFNLYNPTDIYFLLNFQCRVERIIKIYNCITALYCTLSIWIRIIAFRVSITITIIFKLKGNSWVYLFCEIRILEWLLFYTSIDEFLFFFIYINIYIESVIYELRYCKENIVHHYIPIHTYINISFLPKLFSHLVIKLFFMCLFLLSAICPRARESGRCTIFPIMGKVFLQRIQLQLQFEAYVDFSSDSGDLIYFYMFDQIYSRESGLLISVENKKSPTDERTLDN